MGHSKRHFPLFNRVVVLVFSVGLLAAAAAMLATPHLRAKLDLIFGIVLVIFSAVACFGVWVSLTWRNRSPEELAEEQARLSAERPEFPENALVYRFSTGSETAAVMLDKEAGVIYFDGCHVPRKLIASPDSWFFCKIDELKAVSKFRYRGETLTISTDRGKAVVFQGEGPLYAELRDYLLDAAPESQRGFETDHPMMGFVYVIGVIAGIFLGSSLTPRAADNTTLGIFVLVGATLGLTAIHLLVFVADHWFGVGLARPLGCAMFGAFFGVALAQMFRLHGEGGIGLITGLMILGFIFGAWLQRRKRRPLPDSLLANG